MKIHDLKCWREPFRAVAYGLKRHEFRKDDRDFAVGDVLRLHGFDEVNQTMLAEPAIEVVVTYISRDSFGIPDGYCVMSIAEAERTGFR